MSEKGSTEKKNVLILDAAIESSHILYFLLVTRNCRVLQARSTEEMVNLIGIRTLIDDPIDLLLINHFTFSEPFLQMIVKCGLVRKDIPLLIVNHRRQGASTDLLLRSLGPDCPITLCAPESLPDTLDRLLHRGAPVIYPEDRPLQQYG